MLEQLRAKIDAVDDKLAKLIDERMELVRSVAIYKQENNIELYNKYREDSIVSRVTKNINPDIALHAKQIFECIFDASRAYQTNFLHKQSPVTADIAAAIGGGDKSFPNMAGVAVQGVEGAFSSIAAKKLFPICELQYLKNFEGVFNAVEKGLCRFGVLPIENSLAGSVGEVYDLMKKHNFHIARSIKLRVKHNLLAKKGVAIGDIKEIISHEQAINQCSEYISSLSDKIKITVCENTAIAAKMVAQGDRTDIACISSIDCAKIYNLSAVAKDIQNHKNNYTRFICISKKLEIYENSNKISLIMSLPHETGSLGKVLSKFTALGLNLTKLESRPMGSSEFEFLFYFDFEGSVKSCQVLSLIGELDNYSEEFIFLGNYFEQN